MRLRTHQQGTARAAHSRLGFTLAELMIALTLGALVCTTVISMLVRQQRLHRGFAELSELRGNLRDGTAILAAALRSISAPGGDIYPGAMLPHSIEFRATYGSSVICALASPDRIILPPNMEREDGVRLTFLERRADAGSGVLIWDEGATAAANDDIWLLRSIVSVAAVTNPCAGSPFNGPGDASLAGTGLTLDAPLPTSVQPGAPVRLVERVRYTLYKSSDSKWYLGQCTSATIWTGCSTLQPLSGPYRPANPDPSSGLSGMELLYLDAEGMPTSDRLSVASISAIFRGVTANGISKSGEHSSSPVTDSAATVIALRNRN